MMWHFGNISLSLLSINLKLLIIAQAELKQARVLPLLKKPSLDSDAATSYRPISNLPYLSKLIERKIDQRLSGQMRPTRRT